MIIYALGTYFKNIPVYFVRVKEDGTPHFSSEVKEAAFGSLEEIKKLKHLFEEKASQYGPYEIVEIEIIEDDE